MAWNESGGNAPARTSKGKCKRARHGGKTTAWALVALAAAVVSGTYWLVKGGSTTTAPGEAEQPGGKAAGGAIREVEPSVAKNAEPVGEPAKAGRPAVEEPKKEEWRPYSNVRPPNVPEGQAWKPGRPKIHKIDYVEVNKGGDVIHRNATEQTLLNIFTCELGEPPRPLGNMDWKDQKELLDILASPNPVTEKDTENVRVSKEILSEAKAEMAKFVADGGDPQFFLQHYHGILLSAWKKRQAAADTAREILEKDGDVELAKAFVKKVNAELEADGIKRIHVDFAAEAAGK